MGLHEHPRRHARRRYASQAEGLRALAVLVAIMWAVELVNLLDGLARPPVVGPVSLWV